MVQSDSQTEAHLGLQPDFDKGKGLLPVITQEYGTNEVLMLAYMNKEAFEETLKSGRATYFSRSRGKLWKKGETSGNMQHIKELRIDCDNDTILIKVEQKGGAACHLGFKSCFFRKIDKNGSIKIVESRIFDPATVYK
ncbi:MAG: phosphoribosyl-AMP cyclohydrolase [Desulfobacteraceae bacterium]|nr:phosphoribosyl-AMP cyclohydrolase [Desulfobacteraceae bacterium]